MEMFSCGSCLEAGFLNLYISACESGISFSYILDKQTVTLRKMLGFFCRITTWTSSTPCGLSGGLHCPHTFEVSNTARALFWDLLVPSVEQLLCVTRSNCWEFCTSRGFKLHSATGRSYRLWNTYLKKIRLWILWVDRIFKCSFF